MLIILHQDGHHLLSVSRHERMTTLVKESPEGELKKRMLWMFSILICAVSFLSVTPTVFELVLVHRVKIRGVCRRANLGNMGCLLLAQSFKANGIEEPVSLDFIDVIVTHAPVRATAQIKYEVTGILREVRLGRDM